MEDSNDKNLQPQNYLDDETDETLSFCDLPIPNGLNDVVLPQTTYPENDYAFEFFNPNAAETEPSTETVVFCGEIIPPKQKNEFLRHPKNGLFIRRESFKRSHSFRSSSEVVSANPAVHEYGTTIASGAITRSSSVRFGRLGSGSPATGNSQFRSSNSRKHKVLIGLVKMQPKMELGEIRKRQQSRKGTPAPMFPVKESGEPAIAGDHGVGTKSSTGSTSHWALFRPLRCSAHVVCALTKASFGCIPHGPI
ncbi:hypothetical protein TorRG33x02_277260 [Trema orientale]|uniref:Uncharacterized protein n=1 Tax=Trema orientale TaxID=63057 RepID=A0A2P5CPS9_TREOI|nr:hypothetical protein TorRG33x02_277260 [Trema orientale]